LRNLKLNDLESTAPTQSVISQLNVEEAKIPSREELKLEKFGIKIEPTEEKRETIKL